MKIIEVEGIVLNETNYSESSKILNVLTKEYGLIGIMSKGCRNIKSKLRSVSRKLIYGKFHIYYKEDKLSTLIAVDVISSFPNIISDLERISYASYIIDLTKQIVKQTSDDGVFDILKNTLIKLEEGLNPLALTNILELKYLEYLGVMPNISSCSICSSDKNIVTLSSDAGGYICGDCYTDEGMVSDKTIKMIRMYYYVDIEKITKLDVSDSVTKEINNFLDHYYDKYTGLYLKSKEFIKKIKKVTTQE